MPDRPAFATWNYRVLCRPAADPPVRGENEYVLIECYYAEDGEILAWADVGPPCAESLPDFIADVRSMRHAVDRCTTVGPRTRVLTLADLPGEATSAEG